MSEYVYPNWPVPTSVGSLITTRNGGVSAPPYNTFNLGTHVGDNLNLVLKNRALLNHDLPGSPFWLNQTHSDKVICLDKVLPDHAGASNKDVYGSGSKYPLDYDASYTRQKNKVCGVMSADCIPLLLTDKNASFVAAVHAGWRGVENNIIHKTLMSIRAVATEILVYIGPAICKDHFEVGNEVFEQFIQQDIANQQFFTQIGSGKFYCDLTAIAQLQLLNYGVAKQNIYLSNRCTYCESEVFYSYRRDEITGRIASLIWLK